MRKGAGAVAITSASTPPHRSVASPAIRRVASLDIIRGVAVIMVMFCHSPVFLPFLSKIGWLGVDLFFVLSGFLISRLIFQEHKRTGEIGILRFYARRGAKIYPLFWLLLVFGPWAMDKAPLQAWLAEVFLVQDYFPSVYDYTWSLAVEEHFYLALPLILLFMAKRNAGKDPFAYTPAFALGCVVFCSLVRYFTIVQLDHAHIADMATLRSTHNRFDELLVGVAAGYFYEYKHEIAQRFLKKWHLLLTLMPATCVGMALGVTPDRITYGIGLPLLCFGGASMVFIAASSRDSIKGFTPKFLALVGRSSYAIYLFHVPVSLYFLRFSFAHLNGFTVMATYFGGSLFVGWALTTYFEQPLLKLRDRYFPSPTAPRPTIQLSSTA